MSKPDRFDSVTADDVAIAAGVSRWTVNRAFKKDASISAKSREKVMSAAQALGYIPDLSASALASTRSNLVALLVDDFANPHKLVMMDCLTRALRGRGLVRGGGAAGGLRTAERDGVGRPEAGAAALDGELGQPAAHRGVHAAGDAQDEAGRARGREVVGEEGHAPFDFGRRVDLGEDALLGDDPLLEFTHAGQRRTGPAHGDRVGRRRRLTRPGAPGCGRCGAGRGRRRRSGPAGRPPSPRHAGPRPPHPRGRPRCGPWR